MRKKLNPLVLVGIIGAIVFGTHPITQLGRANWGNRNIWWTPKAMALSLNETKNNFELFIGDELLQTRLEQGSLFATDSTGKEYRLAPKDIRVRLNNWMQVKASFLVSAVFSAFFFGVSAACLILGLIKHGLNTRES
ncbi:MAG TPA: hypothetical protein VMW42_09795 [Desulfatiglandales bacterium]|nr:hypothetical protein [Desulfatiglandales bacterium]